MRCRNDFKPATAHEKSKFIHKLLDLHDSSVITSDAMEGEMITLCFAVNIHIFHAFDALQCQKDARILRLSKQLHPP